MKDNSVQVQFVACYPEHEMESQYGWKRCERAFIDAYVDGQHFHIDLGDLTEGGGGRRGIRIYKPYPSFVYRSADNTVDVVLGTAPVPDVDMDRNKARAALDGMIGEVVYRHGDDMAGAMVEHAADFIGCLLPFLPKGTLARMLERE